jgi:predicted enzyme related to lactoylglutathione lyase
VGGIGQIADGDDSPPAWLNYFAVDDTDESTDEVVKLGGNVVRAPFDTPYGRMAIVSDPGGAVFALMATAAADEATETASS